MKVTLQLVCSGGNLAAGAALLIAVIFNVAVGLEEVADMWVYALVGVLCVAVGGFLLAPLPAAVTLLSVPVALFAGLVALLLALGGWAWGPSQAHAINTMLAGAVMLTLLEVLSVVAAWGVRSLAGKQEGSRPPPAPDVSQPSSAPRRGTP